MNKLLNRIYKFAKLYNLSIYSREVKSLISQVRLYERLNFLGIKKFASKKTLPKWEDKCDVCGRRYSSIEQKECSNCGRKRGPTKEKMLELEVPHGPLRVTQRYATKGLFPGDEPQEKVLQFFREKCDQLEGSLDPLQLWRYTDPERKINNKFAVPFKKNGELEVKTYANESGEVKARVFCAVFECVESDSKHNRPQWLWKTSHDIEAAKNGVHSDIHGYLEDFIKEVKSGSVKIVDNNRYINALPPPLKDGERSVISIPNLENQSPELRESKIKEKISAISGSKFESEIKRIASEIMDYEKERNAKLIEVYNDLTNSTLPDDRRINSVSINRIIDIFTHIENRLSKAKQKITAWKEAIDSTPSYIKFLEKVRDSIYGKGSSVAINQINQLIESIKPIVNNSIIKYGYLEEPLKDLITRLENEKSIIGVISDPNIQESIIYEINDPQIASLEEFILKITDLHDHELTSSYLTLI